VIVTAGRNTASLERPADITAIRNRGNTSIFAYTASLERPSYKK